MATSVGAQYDYECYFLPSSCTDDAKDLASRFGVASPVGGFIPPATRPSSSPAINVILLGEQAGIVHRLAVGYVFLAQWVQLRRESESVTLW